MLSYRDWDTGLTSIEQLYTARGSQGFGTFKNITAYGVELGETMDTVMFYLSRVEVAINYEWRPLFTTKIIPDYLLED